MGLILLLWFVVALGGESPSGVYASDHETGAWHKRVRQGQKLARQSPFLGAAVIADGLWDAPADKVADQFARRAALLAPLDYPDFLAERIEPANALSRPPSGVDGHLRLRAIWGYSGAERACMYASESADATVLLYGSGLCADAGLLKATVILARDAYVRGGDLSPHALMVIVGVYELLGRHDDAAEFLSKIEIDNLPDLPWLRAEIAIFGRHEGAMHDLDTVCPPNAALTAVPCAMLIVRAWEVGMTLEERRVTAARSLLTAAKPPTEPTRQQVDDFVLMWNNTTPSKVAPHLLIDHSRLTVALNHPAWQEASTLDPAAQEAAARTRLRLEAARLDLDLLLLQRWQLWLPWMVETEEDAPPRLR